jgi:diguanylate cyclase (GGDEF)-like protein
VRTYLILMAAFGVLAVSAAAGYGFAWSSDQAGRSAVRQMTLEANRAATSVAASMTTARQTVEGLANQPGLGAVFADPAGCNLSAAGLGAFPQVRLDIVNRNGRVLCSSAKSPAVEAPTAHAGSAWLRESLGSSTTLVMWNAVDAATGQPSIAVAERLPKTGAAKGAVVLFLPVPSAAAAMARDLGGPEHPSFTIIDRETGKILSASEAALSATSTARSNFPHAKATGEWKGTDGSERYFASAQVPGSPWQVYAGVKRSAVLATARGSLIREALAAVVALLVLGLAAWLLNRRIARPLRRLTNAVVDAGIDPQAGRVDETGTAEVVALAHEFNKMLDVRAGHEAQLVHQATHDPLTGLPNRVLLADRLTHALHRDRHGTSVGVLFVGISPQRAAGGLDHDTTDDLLIQIAGRLSAEVRPGDTVTRFSDTEFVILCENVVSADAARVAERIQQSLRRPFEAAGSDILLNSCVGLAIATDTAPNPEQLLRNAAAAMGEAKANGGDWVLFDDVLHAGASHRLQTEQQLAQAVAREQLVLHYQPILQVATGRITGAEALVRWNHPERGLLAPMEFIPIAEQSGQIIPIGRYVLTEACRQAAQWASTGHLLRISVNVSVDQLRQTDFPRLVQRVLRETGLSAGQLCLEITESTLIREAGPGWNTAMQLRRLGVHLSIDDFGTGYSSLAYLHHLPVDELKIDRSFISRLDRDPRDRHVVHAIHGMAHALNLNIVAEGVETADQLEMLAEIGCDHAQGYLFARPQPADQFTHLLDRKAESAFAAH